jgi:RNA polymerase sigma-70 factor (ECF subfamily)
LNNLRARKRREKYELRAGKISLETHRSISPEAAIEKKEESLVVREVLSKMKPRYAKILVLRYAGCSYAEVAEAVGISKNSVGTLLTRAEHEFKKRYERSPD